MEFKLLPLIVAALSTLVVGFVWYHPKVFGTVWMRESGTNPAEGKGPNMALVFGMSLFYAFMISLILQHLVIHQWGAYASTVEIDADPSIFENYMKAYGSTYRTFQHGMLHGFMSGLFFALPVIGTNALYERRSWRYTLVTGGYWIIACMIMGGIICAWT